MARSTTRSNQRPDTLMQDRRRQFDEIFLQRTAGPYIRVNRIDLAMPELLPLSSSPAEQRSKPERSRRGQTTPSNVCHRLSAYRRLPLAEHSGSLICRNALPWNDVCYWPPPKRCLVSLAKTLRNHS
jgi:hypothetical protein